MVERAYSGLLPRADVGVVRGSSKRDPGWPRAPRRGWIEDAEYPNLKDDELKQFWEQEHYLEATAAARIADTWIMNYDRQRVGNVALRGNSDCPQLYFLDFDQAFLATDKGCGRPHWIEAAFENEILKDTELLSGFNGRGKFKCQAKQHREHFEPAVQLLCCVTDRQVQEAVRDIPAEWEIGESERRVWAERLLARRKIVLEILKADRLT